MPYSASALGVLPPLWSKAAKKPRPVLTFSDWAVSTLLILAPAAPGWPRGDDGGDERGSHGRPRAGRRQAARRRTAPIGPHGRMLKRRGSSPACVSERNLNTERGKSPLGRQHLVRARHARSPVTLRKKDRCAHAQVSAMCLLVAGLYGRRDTPERTLCRAASSCASSLAAGLFTAHAELREFGPRILMRWPACHLRSQQSQIQPCRSWVAGPKFQPPMRDPHR